VSTITAILEPDVDGTLHLPLPVEMRSSKLKVKVTATLESVGAPVVATDSEIKKRVEALEQLRKLNPFREIADPVAWQREVRKDRPLPGRV
jgi:hypothetical protein